MKQTLRHWAAAAFGAAALCAFPSCTYDPYYTSMGGSYGSGYGYSPSGVSTSLFISTGDPRWGYDPYTYSYYDYRRRCYYDPYRHGYYPIGYRPAVYPGAHHPYGWRPGSRYAPPPRSVRNVPLQGYSNYGSAYRRSDGGWADQGRRQPITRYGPQAPYSSGNATYPPRRGGYENQGTYRGSRQRPETQYRQEAPPSSAPQIRQRSGNGLPPAYNTPVTGPTPNQNSVRRRTPNFQPAPVESAAPAPQGDQPQIQPSRPNRRDHPGTDGGNRRGIRSLGDG
jgi:hypothetical protein